MTTAIGKITFQTLLNSVTQPGRQGALERLNALPMKISANVRFRPIMKAIEEHIVHLNELQNDLVKKHGKKREDGGFEISPDSENWQVFTNSLSEMLSCEIEIPGDRFSFADLFTEASLLRDEIAVSPADINALAWLISIDGEVGIEETSDLPVPQIDVIAPLNDIEKK